MKALKGKNKDQAKEEKKEDEEEVEHLYKEDCMIVLPSSVDFRKLHDSYFTKSKTEASSEIGKMIDSLTQEDIADFYAIYK